jgi:hypothetical protein
VAHAYNPCYSRNRDQKGGGSKPAQANSWWDLILKKKSVTKKGWWSGSSSNPSTAIYIYIRILYSHCPLTCASYRESCCLRQASQTATSQALQTRLAPGIPVPCSALLGRCSLILTASFWCQQLAWIAECSAARYHFLWLEWVTFQLLPEGGVGWFQSSSLSCPDPA